MMIHDTISGVKICMTNLLFNSGYTREATHSKSYNLDHVKTTRIFKQKSVFWFDPTENTTRVPRPHVTYALRQFQSVIVKAGVTIYL